MPSFSLPSLLLSLFLLSLLSLFATQAAPLRRLEGEAGVYQREGINPGSVPPVPPSGLGGHCEFGGTIPSVDCQAGLVCNATAPGPNDALAGMSWHPDSSASGVCSNPAGEGELCYATTSAAVTSALVARWSLECASGLSCYVMDPTPNRTSIPAGGDGGGGGVSIKAMGLPIGAPPAGPTFNITGFCVNATAVSDLNKTKGAAGKEGGKCRIGVPLAGQGTPCQAGLICIATSTTAGEASNATSIDGVCVNGTSVAAQMGLADVILPIQDQPIAPTSVTTTSPGVAGVATMSPPPPGPPTKGATSNWKMCPSILLSFLLLLVQLA